MTNNKLYYGLDYKDNFNNIEITKITVFIGEGIENELSLLHHFIDKAYGNPYGIFTYIEGNLSPIQQEIKLYRHLRWVNKKNNLLLFTTHSPYILNALTLAIKAKGIKDQNIVPKESCINIEDVSIYELTEDGSIRKLPTFDGLPSDDNYLNNHLAKSNQLFDQLLELEDK